jgi:hypothetical protein
MEKNVEPEKLFELEKLRASEGFDRLSLTGGLPLFVQRCLSG